MDKYLVFVEGSIADAGLLEHYGEAKAVVVGGKHDGHIVEIHTHKHNCGAYGEEIACSCGSEWQNAMNGCWQQQHQRQEEGDSTLADMMTLDYQALHQDTPYVTPVIHSTAKSYVAGQVSFDTVAKAVRTLSLV